MKTKNLTLNRCFCGNPFPHTFSETWEKIERDGRVYARCKKERCGHELEAFRHSRNLYWVWPVNPELA